MRKDEQLDSEIEGLKKEREQLKKKVEKIGVEEPVYKKKAQETRKKIKNMIDLWKTLNNHEMLNRLPELYEKYKDVYDPNQADKY